MADAEEETKVSIDDITPDMLPEITERILAAVKIKAKPGESPLDLTVRACKKAFKLPDDDWQSLGTPDDDRCQRFINHAIIRMEEEDKDPELLLVVPDDPRPAPDAGKQQRKEKTVAKVATKKAADETEASPAKTKTKAKAVKAKAKAKANGGGRTSRFSPDAKIKVLAKENPFREGSHNEKVFGLYKNGMTIEAFEAALTKAAGRDWKVGAKQFLAYHRAKGAISVG